MIVLKNITVDRLPSVWKSATNEEREYLLKQSPLVEPIASSLTWLRSWTKTHDEHDTDNPFKPFPDYEYFDRLNALFHEEDANGQNTLFIRKSRTVMATWWAAAECLHYVMTRQPASCIFWCPDQDRAEKCIDYCKVLYAQQDERLKALYPLPRRKKLIEDQAVYRFELGGGTWLEALPGKNPDKIRSEHPTIVCMDEVAFNDQAAEAYANAVATKPKKLLAFSSARAGWFFDTIKCAVAIGA